MTNFLPTYIASRWLAGGDSEFGVHIEYTDLYGAVVFFVCIYCAGQFASRVLTMPALVGEICCGILLGPQLADYVPNPQAWVLFGEIGLILLVLEAGIDIDVSTLKLIGTRGFLIAVVGSVLPIGIATSLALALNGTGDVKAAIAAGASFAPTSLGIALNILRAGGILNTPVGQLIISAAVIDDMIALIILSQLESLSGTIDAASILIPIVSAFCFLIVGGYVSLFIIPPLLKAYVLPRFDDAEHGRVEMIVMFAFLLGMMPATYYAKASYLMGAFVTGLAFCTSHELHVTFVRQFKRILQWLMRIFFAASIGFQVPIKDFADGVVIYQGLLFALALLGKLTVGFMVPNFTQSRSFTELHLRDCLITGFSMAAEGEFAFVIAVFSVDSGLISEKLYASVVLAILISTVIPPFALRFTISYYNKRAEKMIEKIANDEMERNHLLEGEETLVQQIQLKRAVFLCIQTQSLGRWGLMHELMSTMAKLGLDVIDHRAWHPRGIDTTLVNEVYTKDSILLDGTGKAEESLKERLVDIESKIRQVVGEEATVRVQRWYPGVVEEIIERTEERSKKSKPKISLEQRLLSEAAAQLDRKQTLQINATKQKSVEEILKMMDGEKDPKNIAFSPLELGSKEQAPRRRRRQKMRSTPVIGGDLFSEMVGESHADEEEKSDAKDRKKSKNPFDFGVSTGHRAEIIVDGESYDVTISNDTIKSLRTGFSGDMLDSRGVSIHGVSLSPSSGTVASQLKGYVRNMGALQMIEEEGGSETSSTSGLTSATHTDVKKTRTIDGMPPV
ncbi:hypothetical protein FisN_17Hh224 [Fistulifera solaris]|uniref:Cation/H+ exchanger transmembrane domain-containing protein n=1 Tax=Fistulifera solaris TaxID=1519565 RepID=A0A1Z5JH13_FISSO|nr:hypothetical protein FisN_17Hh224 [Fistulifera solaris]|eukprot:GAX13284.1 hypothetical protein FisN_17Hh224 [Fistulifera solaris]